jgi:MOSC domain-containing protein YiiM
MVIVDGERYNHEDALGTLAALAPWWEQLASRRVLTNEFDRLVDAQVAVFASFLDDRAGRRADANASPSDAAAGGDLAALGPLAAAVHDAVRADGRGEDLVLPPSLRLLRAGGEVLRAAGSLPPAATGNVAQLNVSDGGVPKRPVEQVTIDAGGATGDRQRVRKHHGRPWQALCLWSTEVIDAFAAAGHPLHYGAAGENVTIRGLDWSTVRAGVRLRIGEALAECSLFALPCRFNAQWFLGRDFSLMHHDRGPVSRVYARVLDPGVVCAGDAVVLEPS